MSYSVDLRERALQAVRKGHTKAEVRELFGLGENTLRDWENLGAETGSLANRALTRTGYKIDREKLLEWYRETPYSTNKETAIAFGCSVSGIRSAKKVVGITRKKNTIQYTERNEQKREEFLAEIGSLPEDSELYYADESGFDEYYSREYGYALRGEKVIGTVSGRHFARTSIVAAKYPVIVNYPA